LKETGMGADQPLGVGAGALEQLAVLALGEKGIIANRRFFLSSGRTVSCYYSRVIESCSKQPS